MPQQPKRILILSDLHLRPDSVEPGHAFSRFLDRLATPDWLPAKLILLGDTFELCRAEEELSGSPAQCTRRRLARLDSILDRHRVLATKLARLTGLGVEVVAVLGNHDLPLADPAVATRLRERLGAAETVLQVAPRYALVPGVLFAEHGSQYHDINAIRGRPLDSSGRLRLPLAAYAEAASRVARPGGSNSIADTAPAIRAAIVARLAAGAIAEMARRPLVWPRKHRAAVRVHSVTAWTYITERPDSSSGPSTPTLDRHRLAGLDKPGPLDGLDELAVLPMLGRLLRVALTRSASAAGPRPPLASLDALLRSTGDEVPILVFAHTHVAGSGTVPGTDGRVKWFNSGSWNEPYLASYPFVAVDLEGEVDSTGSSSTAGRSRPHGPYGQVMWWNDLTGTIEDAAGASLKGETEG